ncbi:MAG: N-acetylmuramoyl-L-alanine amidase [Lachnospiraceae bacterium]
MKQLSNLTKVMFCIVAVLLVITVALGIATAVKDSKENKDKQGTENVTPQPTPTKAPDVEGNTGNGQDEATPEPTAQPETTVTPAATPEPTKAPVSATGHKIALDPGQQKNANSDKEPVGPGATATTAKMSYGATSVTTKKREYEWTLELTLKIKEELQNRGYEVFLTRDTADVDISNAERAKLANESGADIYVSIQADAAENTAASGIYAQIPTKTNAFVGYMYDSCKALATTLQKALIAETGAKDRGLVEQDTVAAINWSQIPVTVLQLGFMSNKDEDTNLWSADYQAKLVKAICDGIDEYFTNQN